MELRYDAEVLEDHNVWQGFQYKFMLTTDLYHYKPFFEKVLYRVCKNFIREMVTVIEFRHIFGMVFDDYHKPIPLADEISIFVNCQHLIQQRFPLFRMKLIVCGLKIVGRGHVQGQIDAFIEADKLTNMISGFDLVCEEDYNLKTDDFLDQIYAAKMKMGDKL